MIIDIILPLSLIFIMFSLGLGLTIADFKNILANPKSFLVGAVNQMLILPLVTFCIIIIFKLTNELAVGMMILSCCPGGVTSNIITRLAKGDTALSISFTAIFAKVVFPEPGSPITSIFFMNFVYCSFYVVASLGNGFSSMGKCTKVAKKESAIDRYQA